MKSRGNYNIIGLHSIVPYSGGVYSEEDLRLAKLAGTWPNVAAVTKPTIISLVYPNSQLSANPSGGETITINGYNFVNGITTTINGISSSTTFVNANQITVTTPSLTEGTYNLVITNPSTNTGTTTITYSALPVIYTPTGSLGTFTPGAPVNIILSTFSRQNRILTYTLDTGQIPSELSLNQFYGTITGTAPVITTTATYNFTIRVTDTNNQYVATAYSMTIVGTQVPITVSGGSLTTIGNNNYVTFTSGGTFTVTQATVNAAFNYILVGGGGGGGGLAGGSSNQQSQAGGGGAGGVVVKSNQQLVGSYGISIGGGGGSSSQGGDTTFNGYTAYGGGAGGNANPTVGSAGGSGGGGGSYQINGTPTTRSGGAATQPSSASGGYGNAGAAGTSIYPTQNSTVGGGGGGGAGGAPSGISPGSGYTWIDSNIYGTGGTGGTFGRKVNDASIVAVGYGSGGAGSYIYQFDTGTQTVWRTQAAYSGNDGVVIIQFPTTGGAPVPTTGTIVWINPIANASFTSYQNFTITNIQLNAYTYYGDTKTYSATGLPTGLSCSTSGVISGKPTASGTFTATLTVTSSYNSVASSITVTFNILAEFNAWTSPVNGSTITGANYRKSKAIMPIDLTITTTLPGDRFSGYNATGLPSGLSVSGSQIVGTPTVDGSYSVTVTATSAITSATTSSTFILTIISAFITATGGAVSYSGNYKIHTFITTGTLTVTGGSTTPAEYLVVGGGGSGSLGGGGGGGVLSGTVTLNDSTNYTMTVGGGGGNSSMAGTGLTTILAYAGGSGGSNGASGGGSNSTASGGGSQYGGRGIYPGSSYISAPRQGYDGGDALVNSGYPAEPSGGGGAGGKGGGSNRFGPGGGGPGVSWYGGSYGGGGGGTSTITDSGIYGSGQSGGGNGRWSSSFQGGGYAGTAGTPFTGGGGGGGNSGGSGIIIIRYQYQ